MKKYHAPFMAFLLLMNLAAFCQEDSASSSRNLERILGQYETYRDYHRYLDFYVTEEDHKLFIQQSGTPKEEIKILSSDSLKFSLESGNKIFGIRFVSTSDGIVDTMLLSAGGKETIMIKHKPILKDTRFPIEQLQEDYLTICDIIEKEHISPHEFTDKKTMDKAIGEQYNKINKPMNSEEFVRLISPIFGMLGCGHSQYYPPNDFLGGSDVKYLPFKLVVIKDRLYVLKNFSNHSAITEGSEILTINEDRIEDIIAKLKRNISADAFIDSSREYYLSRSFNYYYRLVYGEQDKFKIGIKPNGSMEELDVSVNHVESKFMKSDEANVPSLSLSFVNDSKTAIIKIKHFEFYQDRDSFYSFTDSAFNQISFKESKNLVLDLRGNGGGDPIISAYLLGYVAPKPIKYFAYKYQSLESLSEYNKLQDQNRFEGHLYTLIDGGCFSTTAHLASLLKYHEIGTLIGTEAGGTYETKDGSRLVDLEHTHIKFKISTQKFSTAVTGFDRTQGVMPDMMVATSIKDLLNDRDQIMDFTLNLIAN